MTHESTVPWTFQEGELPSWAAAQPKKEEFDFDFGIGVPAVTPEPVWPLFSRIMLFRLAVALGFLLVVRSGESLSNSTGVIELLVVGCLSGFGLGALLYAFSIWKRVSATNLGPLYPHSIPAASSPWLLLYAPLAVPLFLIAIRCSYWLFESRFSGVVFASLACLGVFYRFGGRPINFMQELILADVSVSPTERRQRIRFSGRPDMALLAALLVTALLVPAYLSTAWGIVAVLIVCGLGFRRNVLPLFRYGRWYRVLAAMMLRAQRVSLEYLDYQPLDLLHWRPPEPVKYRRSIFLLLLGTFDLTMVTALTYYCPWEPFAAFLTPGFRSNFFLVHDYAVGDYRWLQAPLTLMEPDPTVAGFFCFALAIIFFFLIPPIALFVVYSEQLAQLENLAQELKRAQRRGI